MILISPPSSDVRLPSAAQGRFTHEDFANDAETDTYRCPAGELLRPRKGPVTGSRSVM
jgi:hypothetical protein